MGRENYMGRYWRSGILACLAVFSATAQAATINVNCDPNLPDILSAAVASAAPGSTINVSGTCYDAITIDKNDITIIGNLNGSKAILNGHFPQDRITIDGANRVNIVGMVIKDGVFGISAMNNAAYTIKDVEIIDNIIGMDVIDGATATIDGTVAISGSQAFGLEALSGSKVVVSEGATCELFNNFLGAQISVNSSLFAKTGAGIMVHHNAAIGFSVNTGSTAMLFNAKLHTHDNGLDGLDVVSAADFEVDGNSEIISENNGREGISIDNGVLNLFGFFSKQAGFPRVTANGNTGDGVQVESTSKLDIGHNSSIKASANGGAGVSLDDGSSAVLQRSDIVDNNGSLPLQGPGKHKSKRKGGADVVVGFGSRISFSQSADNNGEVVANSVGLALCDRSSHSRGDVVCKRDD